MLHVMTFEQLYEVKLLLSRLNKLKD